MVTMVLVVMHVLAVVVILLLVLLRALLAHDCRGPVTAKKKIDVVTAKEQKKVMPSALDFSVTVLTVYRFNQRNH